jgi:hydroxyacylglutathione hydrolase
MLQRSGARILDVRRQSEFAAGHIPGAVHVPHVQLAQRLGDAPAGDPVIVNCRSGVRSARATSLLRARGINAINLEGGYLAWAAAGLPSETEQPAQA